jgi:hypothetical protein
MVDAYLACVFSNHQWLIEYIVSLNRALETVDGVCVYMECRVIPLKKNLHAIFNQMRNLLT